MSSTPVQLISSTDPRGRRYTAEEREVAFGHWYSCNSLAKTSRDLDIAKNTLLAWHKDDGWAERAEELHASALETARLLMTRRASDEIDKNFETIKELRDDKSQPGKVRMEAAIYMNGILGIVVPKTSNVNVTGGNGTEGRSGAAAPDFSTMTQEQLKAYDEAMRKKQQRQIA